MTSPIAQTGRNRRNVVTGAPDVSLSGGFFIGPEATDSAKFPKDASSPISKLIADLNLKSGGYITSDGVSESEDRSTEKILDWNLDVIDIVETDYGLQYTVTFAEAANAAVLKFIYGSENVTVTDDGVYIRKGARQTENAAILFEIKGKGNSKGRNFAASTQVASIGEISYTKSGLIQYQATIDVLNDVTGTYAHSWIGTRSDASAKPAEGAGSTLLTNEDGK